MGLRVFRIRRGRFLFVLFFLVSGSLIHCSGQTDDTVPAWVEVDNNFQDIPEDPEIKKIYLYSVPNQTGGLGGRAGADSVCEGELPAEHSDLTPRAVMSFNGTDEIRNMGQQYNIPEDQKIVSLSGVEVAEDWRDFVDGTLLVSLNEAGVIDPADNFWSGSLNDGNVAGANCSGFTDPTGGNSALVGSSTAVGVFGVSPWFGSIGGLPPTCDQLNSVVCVAYEPTE